MKIRKGTLKQARHRLESLEGEGRLDHLLTAAAVVWLADNEDYQWIQAPPPATGVTSVEGNVGLAFRPGLGLQVEPQPSDHEIREARSALEGLSEAQRQSLQCLALKALEGDLELTQPPRFEQLEAAS